MQGMHSTGGYWRFGAGGGRCANELGSFPFDPASVHIKLLLIHFLPIYFTPAGHIELSTRY